MSPASPSQQEPATPRVRASTSAPEAKRKRLDRRAVRAVAWAAGAASFALPWAAFQVIPHPATTSAAAAPQQVIVAPAGSTVTFKKTPAGVVSGVKIVTPKGTTTTGATGSTSTPPVATTRATAPPV
jgi:hypothetical protein